MLFCPDRLPLAVLSLFVLLALSAAPAFAGQQKARVWVADSLSKILPVTPAPAQSPEAISIDAARNEYESAQVVVTAGDQAAKVTVQIDPVTGPGGPKPRVQAAFLGFVPVKIGTKDTPPEHLVTAPPADIPDPILSKKSVECAPGKNQPVWLTVYVPKGAAPGKYSSAVHVFCGDERFSVPVSIRVRDVLLPDERTLSITNWFSIHNVAGGDGPELWSEAFWKNLEGYAAVMASHRQNVVITPIFDLITATEDAGGRLTFDFSRLDRWVALFEKAGALDIIEGGHLGGRGDWEAKDFDVHRVRTTLPDGKVKDWGKPKGTSPEQREFLSQFLPALQAHLEKTGWLDRYVQHIADEPIPANAASYNTLAGMVREFAPKLKTIDATMCREVAGSVDIWVPQPPEIDQNMDFFDGRRKLGDQLWFYTCLAPRGRYMNRFIDYHLLSTRLLHWMNFKYSMPGYLHWGFNYWQGEPFTLLEPNWGGDTHLPPGDSHLVYPSARGLLLSIRLEAMRDGIEDYELLRLLSRSKDADARQICDSVVRSMTDYTLDPSEFRKARARILDALEKAH